MYGLYYANFPSHLCYGILIWENCSIGRIFLLQKRAVRIIWRLKVKESCRFVFRENNILKVFSVYILDMIREEMRL